MEFVKASEMKNTLEESFEEYWIRLFNIVDDKIINGVKIKKNNETEIKELKEAISQWERDINKYCLQIKQDFDLDLFDEDNDERYEFQEFKDNIFAEKLWTVRSALKSHDIELQKYRDQFLKTSAAEIFVAVYDILKSTDQYVKSVAKDINYNRINNVDQLKVDYLNKDNQLLSGVIGLGIRSEMLHRLYPGCFAIMTRRSIWGMFFLSKESEEFITDEASYNGKKHRTSHNWEYEYDRFLFYNNFVANLLEAKLTKYGIKVKQNIRFGYVNMFLNQIYSLHKSEIDVLYQWIYEE